MSDTILRVQDCCYLSTPQHVRSFVGTFIWIYTDKGKLTLTEAKLRFEGKGGIPLQIPLHAITNVSVGHYSRIAKPIRLDYMAITFQDDESKQTVLFTPTGSWTTPVWRTNKIVAEWVELLRDSRQSNY